MNTPVFRTPSRWTWGTLTLAAALVGCGGGDDPSPAASLSGVAAVGAPIANGAITVQCAGGSALNTTTSTTGAWQVSFAGQTLPCAVQVRGGTISGSANAVPYHSIAVSLGTVNVTPLTDLIVAQLAGANPQTWFGSPVFTNVNAGAVQTALGNVASGLGIASTLGTVNPITARFKAEPDDSMDKLLEALSKAQVNTSTTYAMLLNAALKGAFTEFPGFGAAFTAAHHALNATPSPSPSPSPSPTGSLTIEVTASGIAAPAVSLTGIPRPANQSEFCSDLSNDRTFTDLGAAGTLTINSCSFANNVGQVSATLSTSGFSIPYSVRYTYN
ncbi:MAG: hypothetical protein Q8M33_04430 [Hydrogenophaga sp.]|nr:hypothetical protein [Hydrogenophaga sp.]